MHPVKNKELAKIQKLRHEFMFSPLDFSVFKLQVGANDGFTDHKVIPLDQRWAYLENMLSQLYV